jgi:hypothetical protein
MYSRHYHTPLQPVSTRPRCPVCREAVYSRAGIHPQCAVRQSDPPRPKYAPPEVPGDLEQGLKAVEQARVEPVVEPTPADRSTAPDATPSDRGPARRLGGSSATVKVRSGK